MFWYQRLACIVLVGYATAAEVSHFVVDNAQTPIMAIRQDVVQERTQKLLHMRRANRLVRAGCWVGAATLASFLTYTFCTECTFFSKDRTKQLEGRMEVVEDILREIAPAIEEKKGFFHRTYRALYDSVTGLPGIAMATTCLWRLIFQEHSLADYMRSTTVHEAHAQVVEQLGYTVNALKVAAHVYSLERIDTIYMQLTQSYNKLMRDAEQLIAYMEFQSLTTSDSLTIRYAHNQQNNKQRITLFSHGIGGTADQVVYYMRERAFCTDWVATFDYADAPAHIGKSNKNTGFAQQREINCFKAALKATIALNPTEIHLYGVSNGASTMINALAQLIEEGFDLSLLKTVVLESPYGEVNDCLDAIGKPFYVPTFFIRFLAKRWYKQLNHKTNKPIDAVHTLSKLAISVLFVTLESDRLVPHQSTLKLYTALYQVMPESTHIITLQDNDCRHANLLIPAYIEAITEFYSAVQTELLRKRYIPQVLRNLFA